MLDNKGQFAGFRISFGYEEFLSWQVQGAPCHTGRSLISDSQGNPGFGRAQPVEADSPKSLNY
jgi:hypothetical protein